MYRLIIAPQKPDRPRYGIECRTFDIAWKQAIDALRAARGAWGVVIEIEGYGGSTIFRCEQREKL